MNASENHAISKTNQGDFLEYFDSHTNDKGRRYFNGKRVISLQWADQSRPVVIGKVQGTYTYICKLLLDASRAKIEDCQCSCPLGGDCKHGAALALAFLSSSPELLPVISNAQSFNITFEPSITTSQKDSTHSDTSSVSKVIPLPSLNLLCQLTLDTIEKGCRNQERTNKPAIITGAEIAKQHHELRYYLLKEGSGLLVETFKVAIKQDGTPGRSARFDRYKHKYDDKAIDFLQESDHTALDILDYHVDRYSYRHTRYEIMTDNVTMAYYTIGKLIETGRCYLGHDSDEPLKLGREIAIEPFWLEQTGKYRIQLQFAQSESNPEEVAVMAWDLPLYLKRETNELGPLKQLGNVSACNNLASLGPITKDVLLALYVEAARRDVLDAMPPLPSALRFSTVRKKREINLLHRLGSKNTSNKNKASKNKASKNAEPSRFIAFPGGSAGQSAGAPRLVQNAQGNLVLELEDHSLSAGLLALEEAGFKPDLANFKDKEMAYHAPPAHKLLELAKSDFKKLKEAGVNVSSNTRDSLMPLELDEENLEIEVSGDDDWWFSLSLNIDVDGKPQSLLPVLISALREIDSSGPLHSANSDLTNLDNAAIDCLNHDGKFIAQLESGRIIVMPFDRVQSILKALWELLTRESEGDDKISLNRLADLLDYDGLANARWFGADKARTLIDRLKGLLSPQATCVPSKFKAELRPYQKEGLSWLQTLSKNKFGGILADDMGLGKTVQILAHIALEHEKNLLKSPFLVVCPTSVMPNWINECEKFVPHLKVANYTGPNRKTLLKECKSAHIVVTTYPIVSRDEELQKISWHGIALDEAQYIKNPLTKVAQSVTKLKTGQRFCITGTPIENHLGELWSQFMFLLPGMLGNQTYFNKFVRRPIEKEGSIEVREALVKRIKPFVMRRTKQEVAAELPPKTVIVKSVEMSGAQRDLYETVRLACSKQVREEIERKGFKMSQIMILDALLKLRQVCCDPRLVKLDQAKKVKESAKLEVLMEMLTEISAEGGKAIVFSQFKSMLGLIEEQLVKTEIDYVKITGDTKDRATPVREFQNGKASVFLISLKAGGTGLNLTAADTVIHYDPWWNPATEDQATDRAHRIGQDKSVFVYKLIIQSTVEQRLVELQERKRLLASQIIDGSTDKSEIFTEEDLELLLAPIV